MFHLNPASTLTRTAHPARAGHSLLLATALLAVALTSGCVTAPPTHNTHPTAAARIPQLKAVVVAPLDAELSELTAGGLNEPRDDWTATAEKNLTEALLAETGWTAIHPLTDEQRQQLAEETEDVQALMRALTLNHLNTRAPAMFPAPTGALTYHTGPLPAHLAAERDAVLFVFVRNSYATAGRKAMLALSMLGAGLTGIAIVPTMGVDVMSAALVNGDGTVLWFNYQIGGGDPRTTDGSRQVAKALLLGLPGRKL